MTEKINLKGLWYLPSNPKLKLPGELNFSPENGIKLDLIGSFDSDNRGRFLFYPILNGFTVNGKKITVLECDGSVGTAIPGIAQTDFNIKYLIIGAWFTSIDEIKFFDSAIHYQYLDEWVNVHGFEGKPMKLRLDKSYSTFIKYKQPQFIELYNKNEMKVLLWFSVNAPTNTGLSSKINSIEQKVYLNIGNKNGVNLDTLLVDIYKFRNFFAFGLSRIIVPTKVFGYLDSPEKNQRKVEIIYKERYYPKRTNEYTPEYTTLFSLEHISKDLQMIMKNWIEKYENLQPVFDRYFDSFYNPHMFSINHFLNLIFAIETYHRRVSIDSLYTEEEFNQIKSVLYNALPKNDKNKNWFNSKFCYGNELSLRSRLKSLYDEFADILKQIEPNRKLFISKILDTRNYYVHYDENLKGKIISSDELSDYISTLSIILQLCLLKELGFSSDEMEKAIKRSLPNWGKFHK